MHVVGTVAQLWRYPVKSMQGEVVERLDLAPGGAAGDRTLAVIDPAAGKVLSGKRWPALMMASARLDGPDVVIALPDGSEHPASDPTVHAALSAWLDHEVRLEPPPVDAVLPMEMHSGMSDESTPVFDWPGPQGTWLDLADVHWLTTASLRAAAALHPDGDWDVRRFRPTAVFEVAGDDFAEDGWAKVDVGDVSSDVLMQTPRCTMPSRAQPGLPIDRVIGTTIRDGHDNNLGLYATIARAGSVALGDSVNAS
jgi:uncharacterized protein YcbX